MADYQIINGEPYYTPGTGDLIIDVDTDGVPYIQAPAGAATNTVGLQVDRSVDGGATWESVEQQDATSLAVTDFEGLSRGETLYRATAKTMLGATATNTLAIMADSPALWVSREAGYANPIPLKRSPQTSETRAQVHQEVHYFAGQREGVEISGEATRRKISASALLLPPGMDTPDVRRDQLLALNGQTGQALYRDPTGRRVYGMFNGLTATEGPNQVCQVAYAITETRRKPSTVGE